MEISVQHKSVNHATKLSESNAAGRMIKLNELFIAVQCEAYPIDPYKYLLRMPNSEGQEHDPHSIEAYMTLVRQNSSHFAEHQFFIDDIRTHPCQRNKILGCAKNSHDLLGYLTTKPELVSADLLYFIVQKACTIVSLLDKAGFALDHTVELLECLQFWRFQNKNPKEVRFQLKFGKNIEAACSADY